MEKILKMITYPLVLVGALNWGLTIFNFNLVTFLLGLAGAATYANIVYGAIGLSALWLSYRYVMKKKDY